MNLFLVCTFYIKNTDAARTTPPPLISINIPELKIGGCYSRKGSYGAIFNVNSIYIWYVYIYIFV